MCGGRAGGDLVGRAERRRKAWRSGMARREGLRFGRALFRCAVEWVRASEASGRSEGRGRRGAVAILPTRSFIRLRPGRAWWLPGSWHRCRRGSMWCAFLADGVGFEPTESLAPSPVFKTGALNRSATHPRAVPKPDAAAADANRRAAGRQAPARRRRPAQALTTNHQCGHVTFSSDCRYLRRRGGQCPGGAPGRV